MDVLINLMIQIRGLNSKEKDLIAQNNLNLIDKVQGWLEFQTRMLRNALSKEESKDLFNKLLTFNLGFENLKEKSIEKFYEDFEKIYNDELSSDFEIQVQQRSFKVHKCILLSRSNYFESILSQDTMETENNSLKLNPSIFGSADIFEILLRYFYLGLYGIKKMTLNFDFFKTLLQMCNYFDIKCATFK